MKILIALVAFCVFILLFRKQWLMAIGNFLIVEDQLHPANVIHVIAGDDYRTNYAIQLYKQGYAKTIFFTGGWCTFHNYYHGLHAQEISLSQSVALEAIASDDSTVTSTYMEVELLKEWLSKSPTPIRSVIVVSDPFHMRRAQWTSRRVLGDSIEVQMAPVPFEDTSYNQKWWGSDESRIMVLSEYEKFIYYIFRYQFSWGKLHEWLETLDRE